MPKVKVCVLRSAGTNCDRETAFAFTRAGAEAELLHVNRLIAGDADLADYQILAIPGGFTYGDDVAAGKIFANELKAKLSGSIGEFVSAGKLIIGICNGFQILVKAGFLPGGGKGQQASLITNDSAKFEDRWVYLKSTEYRVQSTECVWTKGIEEIIYLPVAHGEGKFITKNRDVLAGLKRHGQIVFQYCDARGRAAGYPYNPNGSELDIAGICDETGRVLGLMPHPERHVDFYQGPQWTGQRRRKDGDGLAIFKNAVEHARKNL